MPLYLSNEIGEQGKVLHTLHRIMMVP